MAFQPVVELATSQVIGYEALARWPGLPIEPGTVFAHAQALGCLDELDAACVRAALAARCDMWPDPRMWLFVNAEPAALHVAATELEASNSRGGHGQRLVVELTERSLLRHPADLLGDVARIRQTGARIALDDVGVHPDSLALLDVLAPDIIKLDLSLVQKLPTRDQARTLAAIMAHSERSGALILAEGIETDAHVSQAIACGAGIGQGWKYGAAQTPAATPSGVAPLAGNPVPLEFPVLIPTASAPRTPFDLAATHPRTRTATKDLLVAFSRHIETQALNAADPPIVLSALQEARWFTAATRRNYEQLARVAPLVAIFGRDVEPTPAAHVRGADLSPDDALTAEWTVLALGPQTAVALIARDRDDQCPDSLRRFDFLITYDRAIVTEAARSILTRLV
jgi:EAL domain-containing protein (putative c-di-GMP-specific phosphodiesterase class I)